jgi:molybdopterin molybdotransferase
MNYKKLISFDLARKLIISESEIKTKKTKRNLVASINLKSAHTIRSPINLPEAMIAGLDGYIFHKKSLLDLPISSNLLTPGKKNTKLNLNCAYKINTGSIIPKYFSNFISLENAVIKNNKIILKKSKISNKDIKKVGEDLKKNTVLVRKNEKIDYIKIALLSSVGIKSLWTFDPITVGVFSTGDEIIKLSSNKKLPHQTFDSNRYQIISFLQKSNVKIHDLGIVKDNEKQIKNLFKKFQNLNLIISSGGSSFSSGDFVSQYLELNSKIIFKYVKIQPGRPVIFAKNKKQIIFSLPGNPLAVSINLLFLVSMIFNRDLQLHLQKKQCLFEDVKRSKITKFYRVKLQNNKLVPHNSKGSAKIISLSEADGIAISNQNQTSINRNDYLDFFKFEK